MQSSRQATISGLQRHFRIGYNRAAHLIEAMESKGVVSAPTHDGTRTVIGEASQ
ncbi:DNA translocase FtsK [Dickeya lacustris]|uniref:DNA translocase FtsK n=1 Tax=Dickeya lacustris TaxID=2259638 RepID=UPI0024168C5D|nr:DNA translocase FtsK [Dickeya lacustris]